MPDTPTLDEQGQPLHQPEMIDKARFDGLVRKVEELTLTNRNLNAQLGNLSSEKEQLNAQLGIKDIEKSAAVSEREKQLQEVISQKTAAERELEDLRAMKLKIKVAKDLGRPDLLEIFDTIPAIQDEEALKTVFGQVASFADKAAKARETQLLSGMTPSLSPVNTSTSGPASAEAWEKHVASFPIGSKEQQTARDAQWEWLKENYK